MDASDGDGSENSWMGPSKLLDISDMNFSRGSEKRKLGICPERELQHSCSVSRFRNAPFLYMGIPPAK
jgi:hypothetical protein